MSGRRAGRFDRLVMIVLRSSGARDGGGHPTDSYADREPAIYAERTDVSDGERMRGDGVAATLRARFMVRTEDAEGVSALDRIRDLDADETFDVVGVKRIGFDYLEITAGAQADG